MAISFASGKPIMQSHADNRFRRIRQSGCQFRIYGRPGSHYAIPWPGHSQLEKIKSGIEMPRLRMHVGGIRLLCLLNQIIDDLRGKGRLSAPQYRLHITTPDGIAARLSRQAEGDAAERAALFKAL